MPPTPAYTAKVTQRKRIFPHPMNISSTVNKQLHSKGNGFNQISATSTPVSLLADNNEKTVQWLNRRYLLRKSKIFEENLAMSQIHWDVEGSTASNEISSKSEPYSELDVSNAAKKVLTTNENHPVSQTIQELMQSVVVYVEVRTGEDNRSSGVKKVIAALGARVNDKLLKNTTHVIFKDGLISTYKKAKNWNIPIVSILWIEACKEQRKICDPKEYSISNVDRYENPELYEKMKRFKSMQPGSECDKRLRNKAFTSKSSSKERSLTKSLSISNGITTPSRYNANNFLKEMTPQIGDLLDKTILENDKFFESPASILLKKMNSESNTPIFVQKSGRKTNSDRKKFFQDLKSYNGASRELFEDTIKQNSLIPKNNHTKIHRKEVLTELLKDPSSEQCSLLIENYNKNDTAPIEGNKDLIEINCSEEMQTIRQCSSMQISTNMSTMTTNMATVKETKPDPIIESKKLKRISKNQLSKRKTTFLNKTIETTMEMTMLQQNEKTNDRHTVYRPQNMEETCSADTSKYKNEITEENVQKLMSKKNSDLLEEDNKYILNTKLDLKFCNPEFGDKAITLQENIINHNESEKSLTSSFFLQTKPDLENFFVEKQLTSTPLNSFRTPVKRRTLYNLTMDIISHRVQSINKSTRRSIFGKNLESEIENLNSGNDEKHELNKSATTPNLPSQLLRSISNLKSNQNISKDQNITTESFNNESTPIITKKRKLFIPPTSNESRRNSFCGPKRRKTLNHQIVSHELKKQTEEPTKLLSFNKTEQVQKSKQTGESLKPIISKKGKELELKKTITDTDTKLNTNIKCDLSLKETKMENLPNIVASETSDSACKPKLKFYLVYTNMHKQQIKEIQEAVKKLGKFHIENSVSDATTHVVSLEPRRTLNLLRALIRGLWILEYQWITESLKCGKWIREEPFEIKDFSRAVVICRSERQAFGASYRCELFNHIGSFYISSRCGPISRENLRELIMLCGGKLSANRRHAKYILGDANKSFDDKIYVTPYWILDSITQMQLQKINKYSVPEENTKPIQTSNQSQILEKEIIQMQNSLKAKKWEVSSAMRSFL